MTQTKEDIQHIMISVKYVKNDMIFKSLENDLKIINMSAMRDYIFDKDILYPNSKIYSPKTYILVPQRINMLFLNKPNKRGLPNGIIKCSNGYLAKYDHVDLGICETIEEAYLLYAKQKEKVIKQVADEYKGKIPKKIYDALYNYKADINNDKNYVCS